MAWFKKKAKPKREVLMLDMDKIKNLNESLTAEQVVTLICMSIGVSPDNAVVYNAYECIMPLIKRVEV